MPPKGRGRGRGGQQQNEPGRQEGQQGQPRGRGGPPGIQEPRQPGRAQAPPGFAQPPQAEQPQQRPPPPAQEKPKTRTIDPEELGMSHKLMIAPALPRSPGPGKLGRPIRLVSNCFPLDIPSGYIYHYDVEILNKRRSTTTMPAGSDDKKDKKDKDTKYRCMSTKRNREVINYMLHTDANFRGSFAAYDGRKNMFARHPLKIADSIKIEVELPDENSDPDHPRTDSFEVYVKPVQKKDSNSCAISLDPLHALFKGIVSSVPQDAIMAVETVLRHGPCLRYTPVGRSFFYPPAPQDIHPLGGGREIWFGYHQSLRLGQWKPMVNLDITATTFYEKAPVLKFVGELLRLNRAALQQTGALRDADIAKLNKEFKNMRIETNHLKRYKRKYKIIRFTREPANRLQFTITENGQEVKTTVADYFARTYRRLEFPHLPCVQGNPEAKKVFLPIEVCDMVEGQHCKKKLEERQNAEMIKFTARPPKQRFNEIRDLLKRADYDRDEFLKAFGMKVYNEPMKVEGRILDVPTVRYQQGNHEKQVRPKDGSWDMRDIQYYRAAEIESWVVISFANQRFCNEGCLNRFASLLCKIATEQGISIRRPANIEIVDRRRTPIKKILMDAQKQYKATLALVVVPSIDKTLYAEVKHEAETILGLVTQCVKDDNVVKKCNPPLVSNLCQKINAKAGGVNNSLTPGETPSILRRPVIIMGADVTHPSPSQDIKPSLAAVVGSLDAHPSRYAVTIRAQTNIDEKKQSVEIIKDLQSMVLELMHAFYRNTNGKKPEKIIFYRDGVSEGQFDTVRKHEIKCIRDACRQLNPEYQPGITFIVVQKRHHTRFMPQDDRQGSGRMKNIPPGTTVDTEVTHPLNFDFFLCSHFGLQGTSRPCHYTVLEDDNEFSADDLQKLTFYLCHTYVRCTKSISSPAPVMYAHLAAFRARTHLLSQMDLESGGSTDTSGSPIWHDLPENVKQAINVQNVLKNTMYFV